MKQVRFGIIGVGGMGSGHAASMSTIKEAALAAVCDIDPEVAKSIGQKHNVPHFTNAEDLLDCNLVDAVLIATPHYFHPPYSVEAFKRGIHVLSEKPIAVTVSAADQMSAAWGQSNLKFGVMYQMRALGRCKAARRVVESGKLGEIYRTSLVMGWYRSQAYYDSGGWRATWSGEGGGVLINQAPHFLDLYTWLTGLPTRLTGQTRTRLHEIEVEDEAFATLEYPNGAHGYLYASTTESPGHEMLEICGDRGKLVMHGSSLRVFRLKPSIKKHSREAVEMWGGPDVEEVEIKIPKGTGVHSEITANFCRAILKDEPLMAPGEEGLNAVEMINAIILSSHSGKRVNLPVDRQAYDALLSKLQRNSKRKTRIVEQRTTDEHYAGT